MDTFSSFVYTIKITVPIHLFTLLTIACHQQCNNNGVCPRDKPFCTDAGCVFECPVPFYINVTTCVVDCGDWFVNNQFCVEVCPKDWFVRKIPVLIGDNAYIEKLCVQSCDTNEYLFGKSCVRACPSNSNFINKRSCSTQCPETESLLKNFTINSVIYHECVTSCPLVVEDIYCTDKCSVKMFIFNSTCIDTCPNTHPLRSEMVCVQACPDTTVYVDNNECLMNCTEEKPFYMNRTCTNECPDNFYITNRSGVLYCEEQCRQEEYTYKKTCLSSCDETVTRDYNLFYLNNSCQDECPSNYLYRLFHPFLSGRCVLSCSKDEVIYNRTCVNNCPEDMYLNASKCVKQCPTQFPFHCPVQKGSECNIRGVRPNEKSNNLCVSKCPSGSFIHDNSCVQYCPASFLIAEQTCVPACPKKLPLIQNKTVTESLRIPCFYCYSGWQEKIRSKQSLECVSRCNEDMVVFNSTCIQRCPEKYPYIVNRTCQSEACKTGYMYNDISGITCTEACKNEYFIYNRTCVKECPENVYLTNKTCHVSECESKYKYNMSDLIICTDDCTKYGFVYDETCSAMCPYHVFNNTCVSNCPKPFPMIVNQTKTVNCSNEHKGCQNPIHYSNCVDACPDHFYKLKSQCLDRCPTSHFAFNRTCFSECPKSHPYHQPVSTEIPNANSKLSSKEEKRVLTNELKFQRTNCVSECYVPYNLLDRAKSICVDSCPNSTRYIFLNVCIEVCPLGKVLNEIKAGIECTDVCPPEKLFYNKTCVKKCPNMTYNFNDTECVFECPKSQPLGLKNGNWRCVKSCDSFKVFKDGTCIYESDCTEPYVVFENICLKTCPDNYFYFNSECVILWTTLDTVALSLLLGLFTLLVIFGRTVLKEYFVVVSMIFFKVDERRVKHNDEEETVDQEDNQPLLLNLDNEEN